MIRPPVRVERWIKATWFRGLREPAGLRVGLELGHFVGDVDRWPYQGEKHALPLVSFATFAGERRALAHVEHVTALAFDVDEPLSTRAEIEARLAASMDLAWSFHTSYSSSDVATSRRGARARWRAGRCGLQGPEPRLLRAGATAVQHLRSGLSRRPRTGRRRMA